MIMKKIGSTNAASAISEPTVPVMIFLRLVFSVFIFVNFIFATSDPLLIRSCTREDAAPTLSSPGLPAGIQNNCDGDGDAKWNFDQVWIIQSQVGAGQVDGQKRG
jgi:hypothetical protein